MEVLAWIVIITASAFAIGLVILIVVLIEHWIHTYDDEEPKPLSHKETIKLVRGSGKQFIDHEKRFDK